jgi:hypothetical protein
MRWRASGNSCLWAIIVAGAIEPTSIKSRAIEPTAIETATPPAHLLRTQIVDILLRGDRGLDRRVGCRQLAGRNRRQWRGLRGQCGGERRGPRSKAKGDLQKVASFHRCTSLRVDHTRGSIRRDERNLNAGGPGNVATIRRPVNAPAYACVIILC